MSANASLQHTGESEFLQYVGGGVFPGPHYNPFSCAGPTETVAHCDLSQDRRPHGQPWTPSVFFSYRNCVVSVPLPGITVSPGRSALPSGRLLPTASFRGLERLESFHWWPCISLPFDHLSEYLRDRSPKIKPRRPYKLVPSPLSSWVPSQRFGRCWFVNYGPFFFVHQHT